MALQPLIKGELDWHEKINANMEELDQSVQAANETAGAAEQSVEGLGQTVEQISQTLENKLDIPNVTAQLLEGFLYYDENGNVQLREAEEIPPAVQVMIREQIAIHGGMSPVWETGKSWEPDALMELVRAKEFDKFAIGDYIPNDANKWRIVAKMHYPRWAFSDTYQTEENTAPAHIVLMPDRALGTQQYNSSNINTGGYAASLMPARMETEFGKLPADIKKYVTQTRIYENNKGAWAAVFRNMRIPTVTEIFGHQGWADAYSGGAPVQLDLMKNVKHRIKDYWYWCLDPSSANTTHFCSVDHDGISTHHNASAAGSIRPLIVLS